MKDEAKKQALQDIRAELMKQGKCFISVSVRQLELYRISKAYTSIVY